MSQKKAKWAISSQAAWEQVEGSEIRLWSPNHKCEWAVTNPRARGTQTGYAVGDDMIRPAWRHADPSRNDLGVQI